MHSMRRDNFQSLLYLCVSVVFPLRRYTIHPSFLGALVSFPKGTPSGVVKSIIGPA
jgi:hypothetical protein